MRWICVIGMTAFGAGPATADEFDAAALYQKCVKSCVFIVTPLKKGHAEGTGTLIDADQRLVLTCFHSVEGSDTVAVQFPVRLKDGELESSKKKYLARIEAGQALNGKVLFRDKARGLALVQLDKVPPDTPALPLARKSVRTGESVINIGNPEKVDSTFSATPGTVRGVGFEDIVVGSGAESLRTKAKMIAIITALGPGEPCGLVIDRRGYLVAVKESDSNGAAAQHANSAIDVTEVRAFLAANKVTIKELADEKADPAPKK